MNKRGDVRLRVVDYFLIIFVMVLIVVGLGFMFGWFKKGIENLPEADLESAVASCKFICEALTKNDFCCSIKTIAGKPHYCWYNIIYKDLKDCSITKKECEEYDCKDYEIKSAYSRKFTSYKEACENIRPAGKWTDETCNYPLEEETFIDELKDRIITSFSGEFSFNLEELPDPGDFQCCTETDFGSLVKQCNDYCLEEKEFCCTNLWFTVQSYFDIPEDFKDEPGFEISYSEEGASHYEISFHCYSPLVVRYLKKDCEIIDKTEESLSFARPVEDYCEIYYISGGQC